MNPVRSLSPAVVSGELTHLWVYLTAPILGALLAIPGCRCTQDPGCCSANVVNPAENLVQMDDGYCD